jgi:hypothetical protein
MSNFIIEEERGTSTGRRHPNNGYYAFTGSNTRTSGPRYLGSQRNIATLSAPVSAGREKTS